MCSVLIGHYSVGIINNFPGDSAVIQKLFLHAKE